MSTIRTSGTCFIVGTTVNGGSQGTNGSGELSRLIRTLGYSVLGETSISIRKVTPGYVVGKGAVQRIAALAEETTVIVTDLDLSPSQQRNWEDLCRKPVICRQEVIIEIFVRRAGTREARLQVELARLNYLYPRLTRAWGHLSRQQGGMRGTRGEGETQLEVDRRRVSQQMDQLKLELRKVSAHRTRLRARRTRNEKPVVCLVGYTNAGKSSLMKRLTGAEVTIANRLFATLDPTTRRIRNTGGAEILITDTVGFIRNLPHSLVDAFHSTLEETLNATVLVHVLDGSDPEILEQYRSNVTVLEELGAQNKPTVLAITKIDRVTDPFDRRDLLESFRWHGPSVIPVSSETGEGLDLLTEHITSLCLTRSRPVSFRIPGGRQDLVALLYRNGRVLSIRHDNELTTVRAVVPDTVRSRLTEYLSETEYSVIVPNHDTFE